MLSISTPAEESRLRAAAMAAAGWEPGAVNTLTARVVVVNGITHSGAQFTVVVDDDEFNPTVIVLKGTMVIASGELMSFGMGAGIIMMQVYRDDR